MDETLDKSFDCCYNICNWSNYMDETLDKSFDCL